MEEEHVPVQDEVVATVEDQNADYESDLNLTKVRECLKTVSVTAADWTTDTILGQLEKGNIDLAPGFQRRDAWRPERKSRFIESLFLNLPIPQIVLAEQRGTRGQFLVIDGKQRLLTLRQFAARGEEEGFKPLRLSGLLVRKELNGQTLADIEQSLFLNDELTAYQNQTIRTVVIKNWQDEGVLYLLFHRLNTGSVPLSPQELRQALHPGRFVDFVDEYSAQSTQLWKLMENDQPDFRMRDAELLTRYFAFEFFLGLYAGNLKKFLDDTADTLNRRWATEEPILKERARRFEAAIEVTLLAFGGNAFRRWNGTAFERRFNRAVIDIMLFYFSYPDIAEAARRATPNEVCARFIQACDTDVGFQQSLETTTKSLEATYRRFRVWAEALGGCLKVEVPMPEMVDNRIVVRGR